MAVFPFTVRATDSEGSYADRQFSITVRNSRVERFMALNSSDAFTSPDGTTWTRRVGQGGNSCAYGNGFWLTLVSATTAVNSQWGSSTGIVARKSTDGINYQYIAGTSMTFLKSDGTPWVQATVPNLFNNVPTNVKLVFWNGKFWFVGYGNTQTTGAASNSMILWSSPDGVTWTSTILVTSASAGTSIGPSSSTGQYNINISDGVMIIPGMANGQNAATSAMGWITSDGVTFTPIKNGATASSTNQYSHSLTRINGLYLSMYNHVTTANNTTSYQFSTDGLNWTTATLPNQTSGMANPNQFFYMNGLVYSFAQMNNGSVAAGFYYSSDAINWTIGNFQATSNTGGAYPFSVVAKNGLLIAASEFQVSADSPNSNNSTASNGVRVSVDGMNFTSVSLPGLFTNRLYDIAAMN